MATRAIVKNGIIWSFAESFGVKIVSTFVFFLLAKMLGASQFGLVSIAYAFIDFGDILIEQGMTATLVQKDNLEDEHLDTAFWINIGIGVCIFLLVFAGAPLVASIYRESELSPVLRTAGLVFLIGPSGLVHVAKLTRAMNFRAIAQGRVIALTVGAVISITMAFLGYGVWALVFQKLIFITLSTAYFWLATRWQPRFRFSSVHFQELFSFSYKMTLNNLLTYFSRSSVELLVGYFHGVAAAGIYVFCYKIFQSVIEIANASVNKVMLPLFSSVQHEKEQLVNYFYKAVSSSALLLVPLLSVLLFLAPEAILYFFDPAWSKSIPLLQTVSIGGTLFMIFYYSNSVLISIGKPGLVVKFMFVNGVVNVILLYLVKDEPLVYIGYASIVRSIILLPVAYFFLKQNVPLQLSGLGNSVSRALVIGGLTGLSLFLASTFIPLLSPRWLWLIMQGGIWGVTVLLLLYIFYPAQLAPLLQMHGRFSGNKKI
jgi:PST family polysaccharide transporter